MTDVMIFNGDTASTPRGTDLLVVMTEFAGLLAVLGTELTYSVKEADRECLAAGNAFHQLAAANERIEALAGDSPNRDVLAENCSQITASLGDAVVALQCQDRLAQRIGHIRASLDHLQSLLRDGTDRSYDEWLGLWRDVEAAHRAEQSRLTSAAVTPDGSAELF